MTADILEIFSSVQGEGPFMGTKQIFIRFAKCNLKCKFCDLEKTLPPKEFSVDKLLSIVKQICANTGDYHSAALTGGEPLLYTDFLKAILPKLKEAGLRRYLETNSTLPEQLKEVIDDVDIVAADFKLPSSTGDRDYWDEHKQFLKIACKKRCFVKIVVTNETHTADVHKAVDIIKHIDDDILLVLQPVWPIKNIRKPSNKVLFDYLFFAEKRLRNVRIMPQMHKVLKLR